MNIHICNECGQGFVGTHPSDRCRKVSEKTQNRSSLGALIFTIGIFLLGIQTSPEEREISAGAYSQSVFSQSQEATAVMENIQAGSVERNF